MKRNRRIRFTRATLFGVVALLIAQLGSSLAEASGRERSGGLCSFAEHEQKIRGLRAEVEALRVDLQKAIDSKRKAHLPTEVFAATESIRTLQAQWVVKADELRDLEYHVRFKHPDRGVEHIEVKEGDTTKKVKRTYSGHDGSAVTGRQPASQVTRIGTEARLDQLKDKIVHVYGPLLEAMDPKPVSIGGELRQPASNTSDDAEPGFERVRLGLRSEARVSAGDGHAH